MGFRDPSHLRFAVLQSPRIARCSRSTRRASKISGDDNAMRWRDGGCWLSLGRAPSALVFVRVAMGPEDGIRERGDCGPHGPLRHSPGPLDLVFTHIVSGFGFRILRSDRSRAGGPPPKLNASRAARPPGAMLRGGPTARGSICGPTRAQRARAMAKRTSGPRSLIQLTQNLNTETTWIKRRQTRTRKQCG